MTDDATIYVVDDDAGIRSSLESLLTSVGYSVRTFASVEAFSRTPIDASVACLILDVRLKGRSGLELQRELARSAPDVPIIFITGHGDVPMSVAAMKAGAMEFLTKPFREQDILDAVNAGLERSRERRDQEQASTAFRERLGALSPREREVMELLATGLMNKQVAHQLGLSEVTVKVHRAQVMQKLQARSFADLVRMADRAADL
ncbi:response regulator transcription factor [Aurantimonas sp. HBX-1]|uniref:response regulator transcription factor n=1 Tax=Aurantimonas sp. HBX-1 TaxID=2906072 RepID=UPI001F354CD4|nr:response regulator [Aurantimonas sp. HBX-1]UIJ70389.1 response regulator [Aurantimonas sp. HBX-1]